MLFVLLFIYGKRAVMLFKRRLYNLTRVFIPGMLAVWIGGFSGAARIKLYTHPFVRRSGGLKPRPENPCTKVGKKIIL